MKIETLKDLKEAILLCRKQGVQSIKIDNVEFHLGDLPVVQKRVKKQQVSLDNLPKQKTFLPNEVTEDSKIINEIAAIDSDELTDEQKLFWSSQPEATQAEEKAN